MLTKKLWVKRHLVKDMSKIKEIPISLHWYSLPQGQHPIYQRLQGIKFESIFEIFCLNRRLHEKRTPVQSSKVVRSMKENVFLVSAAQNQKECYNCD